MRDRLEPAEITGLRDVDQAAPRLQPVGVADEILFSDPRDPHIETVRARPQLVQFGKRIIDRLGVHLEIDPVPAAGDVETGLALPRLHPEQQQHLPFKPGHSGIVNRVAVERHHRRRQDRILRMAGQRAFHRDSTPCC
ncbi:hypothetical protein SDC9_115481 [bioreactor metagenome]|uniref:Uncharacterized protein n=1 Tax=bioreactor metagenome TaxID=1076179 RepID=A0A645BTZ8_9ZZZZ